MTDAGPQASGGTPARAAAKQARLAAIAPPDLPALEPRSPAQIVVSGRLVLDRVIVEADGGQSLRASHIAVSESELRGVCLEAAWAPGLRFSDAVMRACDLSNVDGREGSLRRVEVHDSRLVGFGLAAGTVQDVRILDSSLTLASLAFSKLRAVSFERVDLTEASFMQAQLEGVTFIDCCLAGTDFRAARLRGCRISGASLEGVLGADSLSGVTMDWVDVLESAGALAAALGIIVDQG